MSNVSRIRVAHGDGIGPEIMAASLHIIQSGGALLGRVTETLRTYNGAAGYTLAQGQ